MALLQIMAVNHTHTDPTKDLRGCYKRGDVVAVYEDDAHNGDLVANPIMAPFVMIRLTSGAVSSLAAGVTAVATSFTLPTGHGASVPAPPVTFVIGANPFTAGSVTEVARATAVNGDVLTVVRGLRGTTAQAWPISTPLQRVITKAQTEKYLARAFDGVVPTRRRLWRILIDDLPPAFIANLTADRWAQVTWAQARDFIQNKVTLATES